MKLKGIPDSIYAYTEPGSGNPAYVICDSLDGKIRLTVRGNGSETAEIIGLDRDDMEDMVADILNYLHPEDIDTLDSAKEWPVVRDVAAASKLAELVLSMGMATEKSLVARRLAREVLGITDAGRSPALSPITTNGTTRLVPNDEPVFLLRGQDKHAADAVRYWAGQVARSNGNEDIIKSALEHANKMDAWPNKKLPDLPYKVADEVAK